MADGSKPTDLSAMRVLFLGMTGILSRVPLTILLNAGVNVCGLVLPSSVLPPYVLPKDNRPHPIIPSPHHTSTVALMPSPGILQLAGEHHLPVYPIRRLRDAETIEVLTAVAPDLICVSCFNQILPPALLAIPPFGCLNLHPSRLPQFRGPSPLFWTLRNGQNNAGVTIHFMDEGLDTGDIVLQAGFTLPNGISWAQLEQMAAERGGRLLLDAIQRLANGRLPRQPQPENGSYQSSPTADDFRLDTNWSAQWAFNFMRGTAEWARPYTVQAGNEKLVLHTAVACYPNQTLPRPFLWQGTAVSIQFNPGVLKCQPV